VEIAADRGFAALTMRTLAAHLGITVRPLYNHVHGRQDVVDLVAARLMSLQPAYDLDADQWQDSVRRLYAHARQAYRVMGRAILFPLDETVTPVELPIERILQPERLLTFLTAVGLTLEDALAWRAEFLSDMLGFVLLVDHRYDRAAPEVRSELHHPVPRRWLEAHPAVDAPLARAATTLTEYTSDDLFDRFTDRAITTIAALRRAESSTEAITEASAETAVGDART
jgi:AcrR family transcriptional regulator